MSDTVPFPGSNSQLLSRFRADRKRLPLHPLEKAVLAVVALHLCFLPWAMGAMGAWAQITSLGLSLLSVLLALCPRNYTSEHTGGPAFRLNPWPRLFKFPLFWLGLALLGYIAVQGANPSWVWERSATQWWLRRVDDIDWLPTSIDTPFERFNLWRQFIIYASAWLTVCTLWVGFTRRHALQTLLLILVGNAAVLALLGFTQRISGTNAILWQWDYRGASVFSTFIYKNHAGAYFALLASLAIAAASWTRDSGERAMKKSTPASLLLLTAILLTAGVLASASRGAVITLALFFLATLAWYLIRRAGRPGRPSSEKVITTLIILMFAGISVITARYLDFSQIQTRFAILSKDARATMESRNMAYTAGMKMLDDHGLRGVGAGGFRFLFTEYIKHYPIVYEGGRLFWEHAHRDWLEIPIELGAAGSALLLVGGVYWLVFFYRKRATWHSLVVPILLGCLQPLVHAWFDFPFQCPAILITWLALLCLSARWLELDAG